MDTRDREHGRNGNGHGDASKVHRYDDSPGGPTSTPLYDRERAHASEVRGPGGFFERAVDRLRSLVQRRVPPRRAPTDPQMIAGGARDRYTDWHAERAQPPRAWDGRVEQGPPSPPREPSYTGAEEFPRGWTGERDGHYSEYEGYYERPMRYGAPHPPLRNARGPEYERERLYDTDRRAPVGWRDDQGLYAAPHRDDGWRDEYRTPEPGFARGEPQWRETYGRRGGQGVYEPESPRRRGGRGKRRR